MKGLFKNQLRGGALYYAVVVTLLLSMIAMGFILLNRLWFREEVLFSKNRTLNDDLDSASELLMAKPGLVNPGETKEIDLYGDSSLVKIEVKKWGLLRLINTSAQWRSLLLQRASLYSELMKKPDALYLSDRNKFLSLVGKCTIKGDCSLPALGIRAGEMDGGTFTGKRMIDGKIYQSGKSLPGLSPDLLRDWSGYLDKKYRKDDSIVKVNILGRNPVIRNSFREETLVLDGGKKLSLQNMDLSGNIIVVAEDTLLIDSSARLQDVLVYAKTIILSDEVKGAFQLYARNNISIGSHCTLRYPSFAVCLARHTPCKITLGQGSSVIGGILINSEDDVKGANRLEMTEGNKLAGMIYVEGEVCFNGEVYGNMYCNSFYLDTPRAYYENFLKDAVIDSRSVQAKFGSFVTAEGPHQLKFIKQCL